MLGSVTSITQARPHSRRTSCRSDALLRFRAPLRLRRRRPARPRRRYPAVSIDRQRRERRPSFRRRIEGGSAGRRRAAGAIGLLVAQQLRRARVHEIGVFAFHALDGAGEGQDIEAIAFIVLLAQGYMPLPRPSDILRWNYLDEGRGSVVTLRVGGSSAGA